jgi:hypothetical protein
MSVRIGPYEIRGDRIGKPYHTGTRDGVDFNLQWEPGMGEQKLADILGEMSRIGANERTQQIGRLLGVVK